MTPDDFPTREAYLKYVKACEASIVYTDRWDRDEIPFAQAVLLSHPAEHTSDCKRGVCWCTPDSDGLYYYYAKGIAVSGHVTSPPFTFKDDHDYDPEECLMCMPEIYYSYNGENATVDQAEARFWEDHERNLSYLWQEYLGIPGTMPLPDPDKIGSHP